MFFFLLVFTLCWCFSCFSSVKGFVYPMWGEGHSQKQQGLEKNDDGWVAEFLMDYFVLPLKDGFCHVCSSFQEVYECIVRSELFEDKQTQKQASYIEKTLDILGLNSENSTSPPSCSYYSILVVATSTIVFVLSMVCTKKLLDYFREEHRIFSEMAGDFPKKCPCFDKD
ncbi:uncharacterized protein LOC115880430 [Sitophilus oryzae]|uniref:Uncharacterized protein LOC115880430 n=1 Tax=Sitophilus oryzae TaxID=7048 RepID=A0A6J2XPR4_SITOR|nr:uncharacterized protein LOC115880430 [Sitophilus oryzae]